MMSFLFTGELPNLPQINSLKYLTYSVCFNHCLIPKITQDQLGKINNAEYMLQSLVDYQIYPKSTKTNRQQWCLFFSQFIYQIYPK